MSVIKSKRSTSDMEFLATARKLEIYTIQKCVNFPKRYTFYVSQPLAAAATRIYEDVKRANSIYPLNQHEVQIRRDYFLHANAELQSMISQLEVAQELFGIEMDTLKYWMDIVDTEIRLVVFRQCERHRRWQQQLHRVPLLRRGVRLLSCQTK